MVMTYNEIDEDQILMPPPENCNSRSSVDSLNRISPNNRLLARNQPKLSKFANQKNNDSDNLTQ
jgi:hypothetical protein